MVMHLHYLGACDAQNLGNNHAHTIGLPIRGPEVGSSGGRVVGVGTPEELAKNPASFTCKYLAKLL